MIINDQFLRNVFLYLEDAVKTFDIDTKTMKTLKKPEHILGARLKFSHKGKKYNLPAWRVQNNSARGPYKGGIRFHPGVNEEELQALALGMSLKTALYNLPFGGAKGGVQVNPRTLGGDVIQKMSRQYIRAFHKKLGPYVDIPAPDLNTNDKVMAWMMDEYSRIVGRNEPGVVTGKPKTLGGSELRSEATAYGGYFVLKEALRKLRWKKKPAQTTVAIQGFGNVGRNIAKILYKDGFKIIGISDFSGAIKENGARLNPIDIEEGIRAGGVISGCYLPGIKNKKCGVPITNDELFALKADILIPAAAENQIHKDNAKSIKAKIILEMANGPTTHEAEEILLEKGALVIPDILANGGGVLVSYFEWVQDLDRYFWKRNEVLKRLRSAAQDVYREVYKLSKSKRVSMREASYGKALINLEKTFQLRGII